MRVLVGDIGGTKTVLAVAECRGDRIQVTSSRRFASGEHASLEAIARAYLEEGHSDLDGAALAVAGPVVAGRSETTNLPWVLDSGDLARGLGLPTVRLLNDLEAVAWGVPALAQDDFAVLHPGEDSATGNACVVAAGTGLGQAGMYWDGERHHPFATEGGHSDFAPSDAHEMALFEHLRARFGHVSWERLVSGQGIVLIHDFLTSAAGDPVPDWLQQAMRDGDPAAAIAQAADKGRCAHCAQTMALFLRLYGREAGNMALKQMALGGVYLGGGIAPKHLAALRSGPFLEAFFDKGRMRPLMRRMPVKVILAPEAPLYGAARYLAAVSDSANDHGARRATQDDETSPRP